MNPVVIGRGRSFKGLAQYLLHDPKAQSAERVGWIETVNLGDADPDRAWRLMAGTAKNANALKEAAGLRKGGGQNKKPAYHYTITFPERDAPTEALQKRAMQDSLKALGMSHLQAMAVQHLDGKPHFHVMVNMISPDDGTTVKLSHDHKKLSSWAQKFEKEHGLIVTAGRAENERKRQSGEYVDARRKSRNVYEREQREGRDRRAAWLRRQEDGIARTLAAEAREMRQLHNDEWQANKQAWLEKKSRIKSARERDITQAIDQIKADFKTEWAKVFQDNRDRLARFDQSERNVLSQAMNTASAFFKARKQGDSIAESFMGAMRKDDRRGFVEIENNQRLDITRKQLNAKIKEERTRIRRDYDTSFKTAVDGYHVDCEALRMRQQRDRQIMRDKWREYNNRRQQVHEKLHSYRQSAEQSQYRGRGMDRGYDYEM